MLQHWSQIIWISSFGAFLGILGCVRGLDYKGSRLQNIRPLHSGPALGIRMVGPKNFFFWDWPWGTFLDTWGPLFAKKITHESIWITLLWPSKLEVGLKKGEIFAKKYHLLFKPLLTPGTIYFCYLGTVGKLWHVAKWKSWKIWIFMGF